MSPRVIYPHIEKPEGQAARLERLPRIRVAQIVMDYFAHGWSAEEMCRQHPYLSLAEAHTAMAYYFDHQVEIDDEIKKDWEAAGEARTAPISPFLAHLRAKKLQ